MERDARAKIKDSVYYIIEKKNCNMHEYLTESRQSDRDVLFVKITPCRKSDI